jgi:hypothetical protein
MKNLDSLTLVTTPLLSILCCTLALGGCTRDDSLGNDTRQDSSPDLEVVTRDSSPTPDEVPLLPDSAVLGPDTTPAPLPDSAGLGPDTTPAPLPDSAGLGPDTTPALLPDSAVFGPDTTPAPDTTSVSPEVAWSCNAPPRVDDAGVSQWSWYFHWSSSEPLASVCASYGVGAKVVLEVDLPTDPHASSPLPACTTDEVRNGTSRACVIAGAYRFEVDCAAGELYFELPSENTIHAWYHMEGSLVTQIRRYIVGQGVECSRSIFVVGFAAAPTPDAGPLPQDAGDGDAGDSPFDAQACSFNDGGVLPRSFDGCVAAGGKVVNATDRAPTLCAKSYEQTRSADRVGFQQCQAVGGYTIAWDGDAASGTACTVFYPQNGCPTGPKPDGWTWY